MSRLPLVLLLGLTLGFAACGDGGGQDRATPTTAAQPSPTAATSRRTDIPEVDAVLDAVESGDPDRVSALLRFTPILCEPSTPYFHCGLDHEGSLVDVIPISICEEALSDRHGVDAYLRATLVDPALYGVYKAPPGLEQRTYGVYPPAEYIAVFSRQPLAGREVLAVAIDRGEIVKVFFATPFPPSTCASTPAEIVAALGLEDAILPPVDR